jgi:pantothenate kinase
MSRDRVQVSGIEAAANSWLAGHTNLTTENRLSLAATVSRLLGRIETDRKMAIGIAGAPGSGKSTLARCLVSLLDRAGLPACHLSLDDYYLPRARREWLARTHHPLLLQRGVPGTHELDRLMEDLDRIRNGSAMGMNIPVFDKSADDRAPPRQWRTLEHDPLVTVPRSTNWNGSRIKTGTGGAAFTTAGQTITWRSPAVWTRYGTFAYRTGTACSTGAGSRSANCP